MQRIDAPEILDSDACSPADVEISMRDIGRVNRWFGGVATTQKIVERVANANGLNRLSLLEVAAGSGEVPEMVRQRLARRGIALDATLLDRAGSHLPARNFSDAELIDRNRSVVADAFALPFGDGTFDLRCGSSGPSCCIRPRPMTIGAIVTSACETLRYKRLAIEPESSIKRTVSNVPRKE